MILSLASNVRSFQPRSAAVRGGSPIPDIHVLNTADRLALTGLIQGQRVIQACAAADAVIASREVTRIIFTGLGAYESVSASIFSPIGLNWVGSVTNDSDNSIDSGTSLNAFIASSGFFSSGTPFFNVSFNSDDGSWNCTNFDNGPATSEPTGSGQVMINRTIGKNTADPVIAGTGPGDGTYIVTNPEAAGTEGAFTLQ